MENLIIGMLLGTSTYLLGYIAAHEGPWSLTHKEYVQKLAKKVRG